MRPGKYVSIYLYVCVCVCVYVCYKSERHRQGRPPYGTHKPPTTGLTETGALVSTVPQSPPNPRPLPVQPQPRSLPAQLRVLKGKDHGFKTAYLPMHNTDRAECRLDQGMHGEIVVVVVVVMVVVFKYACFC
ncbi:hypothetical protein E2C01_080099 [Portunus trituberculatus]|uniref:Uncharacterized protein n=1 Tax=Portunus trituberculatus TaxID=210409 RepID=A0A5B7IT49_PORTR|nr:hypothetical protein [Portunus trituberculatus]